LRYQSMTRLDDGRIRELTTDREGPRGTRQAGRATHGAGRHPTRRYPGRYSGKRHKAGVSVQVLADRDGRLLAVSDLVPAANGQETPNITPPTKSGTTASPDSAGPSNTPSPTGRSSPPATEAASPNSPPSSKAEG